MFKNILIIFAFSLCGSFTFGQDKPAQPLVGTGLVAGAAGADDKKVTEFAYRSGSGVDAVEYRVTASGLASISIGGNIMAKGRLEAQDFSGCLDFKNNYDWRKASRDKPWEFREKSIEVVDAKHARVVQKSAEVEATYDYLFVGEDVEVQCLLKNVTENTIFQGVDIGGLLFMFDREPTGLFNHLRVTYPGQIIPTCREPSFHPSFNVNFGGSELVCDGFGVGVTPLRTGWSKTALSWEGHKQRDKAFHYTRAVSITPGSAFRCDFLMRVSRNKDWKYLLEPYKKHFNATFGPVRYKNNNKPIGYIQGTSDKWIKAGNPYGYGGKYRFDTEEGTKIFIEESIAALKKANAQGMIIWSFTPYHPRGANFRPDTDCLPAEVWKQIPTLTGAYKEAGLGIGICMRPQIVTTYDWEHDTTLTIHPDDLSQLGLAIRPFNKLMEAGMNTFYLDTFGGAWNDARTMAFLRGMWGDKQVFTATEFFSDVSLLFAPGYTQYNWNKEAKAYKEYWGREHLWEVCQWMSPGVQLTSPQDIWDDRNERPEGTPDPFRFLYQNHVIPIFFTAKSSTQKMVEQLADLTKEFLDESGQWKK
jgi:hypothetical protein